MTGIPAEIGEVDSSEQLQEALRNQILEQLTRDGLAEREIGLALLFGGGWNPSTGTALARVLKGVIEKNNFLSYPEFNKSLVRPFYSGTAQYDQVNLNLHLFTTNDPNPTPNALCLTE